MRLPRTGVRRGELAFLAALLQINVKASLALRGVFWAQACFMLLNNLTFFVVWIIFFQHVESIAGWRIGDVALIFGVAAAGFGLMLVFAGGVETLSRSISTGELDAVLVQPRSSLLHEVGSRSRASGWGDFVTGLLFLGWAGALVPAHLPFAIMAILASFIIFTSLGIIVHSLAFWFGDLEALARQVQEFTLTFSLYPAPLFSGVVRIILFTLLPAALISHLPAEAIREPGLLLPLIVAASTTAFALAAFTVFRLGLRRYESGSGFGLRH